MDGNKKIIGNPNAKTPAYVAIYESIYEDIKNGVYRAGSQLPTETKLAEEHKVSRNTLRQALAILNEDGLVYNVQGKGNFVSPHYKKIPVGLEKLTNPILDYARNECDKILMDYHFEPPAKIVQEKLSISASEITLDSNNDYYYQGATIAHSFIEIPVTFINDLDIDLNKEENVYELMNKTIYEAASTSFSRIRVTSAEEETGRRLGVEIGTQVIFIEEILYDAKGKGIALCKYYLLPEEYDLHIIRKK